MKSLLLVLGLLATLAVWIAPAQAQRSTHWTGQGAFSPDSSLLAFYVQGRPANEVVVLEMSSGRSFLFELAAPHVELQDLSWAPSGNILLFVSMDPAAIESKMSDRTILGGHGSHVWAITFTAEGPQPAKVIAQGQGVRLPALSRDGAKVAYFQGVWLPGQERRRTFMSPDAYAVFERDISTGEVARAASSQYKTPRELFYDGDDAWLFSADDAAYPRNERGIQFWGIRPAPPGKGSFGQLTNGISAFRMMRGEVLPDYPDHIRPYPENAPPGSSLAGMMSDGRPMLFGIPGETTAGEQLKSVLGDVPALTLKQMTKRAYIAVKEDGTYETYFAPEPPGIFHWDKGGGNTGGAAADSMLKRYFRIQQPYQKDQPSEERYQTSRLFVYEQQALVLERDVADILAKSTAVEIAE